MEISAVRQQMLLAIERAKRAALDRRAANDAAARQYGVFLDQVAVPLFRQAANVLRAEGYFFSLFTPGGSVRRRLHRARAERQRPGTFFDGPHQPRLGESDGHLRAAAQTFRPDRRDN